MISNLNLKPTGLSLDSRQLKPGEIFFAVKHQYIDEALKKGACAIFHEESILLPPDKKFPIPLIPVANLAKQVGHFASEFYNNPSHEMHVVGVTGTNGKTSITHFLAQAFQWAGFKSAVIGTLGSGEINHLSHTNLTTPDPIFLQKTLAEFKKDQVKFVAMEASSHGLEQGRTNGTQFETGIFTNLTQDHLDYHGNMENYARAKYRLFEQPQLKHAVFNLDDPYGLHWAHQLKDKSGLKVYGICTSDISIDIPLISTENIKSHPAGLTANVTTPWGKGELSTTLWGKFNLNNVLAVLTTLLIYNIPLKNALSYISQLTHVAGRMHLFKQPHKPLVIVDYAHTPDALLKTLQTIREHCTEDANIWCIFGAGGDRDNSKRAQMGRAVEQYAHQIILTNDNPRSENPLTIIAQIREGLQHPENTITELSREKAISHALSCAKPQDVILVAGKGHESTQEIMGEKIPYSDILTVKRLLTE